MTILSRIERQLKNIKNETDLIGFKIIISNQISISKCHQLVSLNSTVELRISSEPVMGKNRVKLLGVHTEGCLSFDYHIKQLCKKASKSCMLCQK